MIPSQQRATILSFDSLMASSGGVVAQPVLGKSADVWGYPTSYVISAGHLRAGAAVLPQVPSRGAPRRQRALGPRSGGGARLSLALELEQEPLALDAARVPGQLAARADHPVAGDDDRDRVPAVGRPDGPRRRRAGRSARRSRGSSPSARTGSRPARPTPAPGTGSQAGPAAGRTPPARPRSTRRVAHGPPRRTRRPSSNRPGRSRACGRSACAARAGARRRRSEAGRPQGWGSSCESGRRSRVVSFGRSGVQRPASANREIAWRWNSAISTRSATSTLSSAPCTPSWYTSRSVANTGAKP